MAVTKDRPYEVILWGATGFTGKLVAEYLLQQYGVAGELRWALGGRNATKLEALRDSLGESASGLPLVMGDGDDASSMDAIAAQAKVICSTVGPYAKYGSALVAACAKHGTHYCDLAGEPHWIRAMIDAHHNTAVKTGARIVSSCGFDSVPSDLGVHFLQTHAQKLHGQPCTQIKMRVKTIKGAASGGTIASIMGLIETARKDRNIARILKNPYGLNPPDHRSGPDKTDLQSAAFDQDFGVWIAPFVMSAINTRIVRRSHALLGFPYGEGFRYDEAVIVGKGIGGRAKATGTALGLGAFTMASAFDFTRGLLRKRLPKPGQGPSRQQRENGFFDLRLLGKLPDGTTLAAKVTGDRDPGYGSTAKMLGESAVCLAKDPQPSGAAGLLTPASAMAEPLLSRLEANAGLRFEILDTPLE